jgi:hypothetical protein
MTCRSHPGLIRPKMGTRRTIVVLRCCLLSGWSKHLFRGEPCHLVQVPITLAIQVGGRRQARCLQITLVTSVPCIEAELRCRGFESVVRYIAEPTISEALFSYRRAAKFASQHLHSLPNAPVCAIFMCVQTVPWFRVSDPGQDLNLRPSGYPAKLWRT